MNKVHDTLPEDQQLPKDESQSRVKEERKDEEVTPKSEPATAEVKEEEGDQDSEDLNEELRGTIDAFPPDSEDSLGPEHVADELPPKARCNVPTSCGLSPTTRVKRRGHSPRGISGTQWPTCTPKITKTPWSTSVP